jgi:hypothetical protein
MKVLRLHRYTVPGPPPVGGPKTLVVYLDDEGKERVKVIDKFVMTVEEAEYEVMVA